MSDTIKYTCNVCGKIHDEWPALTFTSPTSYNGLSDNMKKEIAELSSDFCIIRHTEQTDRFIRATLSIKVIDHCETLEYGIWVSLSEKSFQNYSENFGNPDHQENYFGWLSNNIPEYDPSVSIPTTVITRLNSQRPEIVPHENFDHQLIRDYYLGISKAEAEKRIEDMLNGVSENQHKINTSKPWWKFWRTKIIS
jgi:hypothetical protein